MPISNNELHTDFIETSVTLPLANLIGRLPSIRTDRLALVIVAALGDGRYLAASWGTIEQTVFDVADSPAARVKLTLADLQDYLVPSESVAQDSLDDQEAQLKARRSASKMLVVQHSGRVVGLVIHQLLSGAASATDPFAGSGVSYGQDALGIPPDATLGDNTGDNRVFNAWVSDHSPKDPLKVGESYELCFNVDKAKDTSVTTVQFDASKAFAGLPPDVQTVTVTVAIDSDDFVIHGDNQLNLSVPRDGKSKNTVRFTIEPTKNGPGEITALFIANNRIFQKMTLTMQVGELPSGAEAWSGVASGAMLGAISEVRNHTPINLVIEKRDNGYRARLIGTGISTAMLNISETKIAELILRARDELKNIVYLKSQGNRFVYQQADTNIPLDMHQDVLKRLARVGFLLYQSIFFAPGNGPDAQTMGTVLRQLSQQHQLHITVVAERFVFPWGLLYDKEQFDPNAPDSNAFWGFKHVIEYMPEFSAPTLVNFTPQIKVKGALRLGFVCNTTIDDELTRKGFGAVVKPQSDYFKTLPGVELTEYPNTTDLYGLLNNANSAEELLYFYCHAVSVLPGEQGGVNASKLVLSDGATTLEDLNLFAPINAKPLQRSPLVFLNACQSAELSPYLYDGLVPYLMGKGVRGIIGTEVDTPALFAAEFAQEFLRRFTAGNTPLGDLLLNMRQEYLTQKNNVMPLLYALYSNGDVVVQREAA
jgi:hypothetical protein